MLEMPSGTGKTVSLLSLIVSYQQVSTNVVSMGLLVLVSLYLLVLSDQKEARLLFSNSPGNRKGFGRTKTAYGISDQVCRNRGAERKGAKLYWSRTDKSEEPLSSS